MKHHDTRGERAVIGRAGHAGCGVAARIDVAATRRVALLALISAVALLLWAHAARAQADPSAAPDSLAAPTSSSPETPTPGATPPVATPSDSAAGMVPRPASTRPAHVGQRKVRLVGSSHNVARSGPGNSFAIAGVFPKDATFPVIAKSGEWYNVRLSDVETGWVHSSLCLEYDDLSDLEFRPNPKEYTRTGSFVLGGYGGAYAFDRKSNSMVVGGRLGYYVFDRFQVEGGLGWTHVHRPAEIVESLFGLSLEADDFQMLFYQLNATFEILPGRQMVPFVSAGVGSAIMKGETEASLNFGAGTMLFLSKRLATRWEFRDYRFDFGPDAARVSNDNVEFSVGTVVLF